MIMLRIFPRIARVIAFRSLVTIPNCTTIEDDSISVTFCINNTRVNSKYMKLKMKNEIKEIDKLKLIDLFRSHKYLRLLVEFRYLPCKQEVPSDNSELLLI